MTPLIINWIPLISTIGGRQIRPEEEHNLMEIKGYIKNTLIDWVNRFITYADLINNPRSRTPENIFPIIERILELMNSIDAGTWGTSSIPVKIFSLKNPSWSLVWILWTDIRRYKNNPDLLLHDLDISDAYYNKSYNIKGINNETSAIIDDSTRKFREAFNIVMRNKGWRKDNDYDNIHFDEFELDRHGHVRLSKRASPVTIRKKDIVHRIQQVLSDL